MRHVRTRAGSEIQVRGDSRHIAQVQGSLIVNNLAGHCHSGMADDAHVRHMSPSLLVTASNGLGTALLTPSLVAVAVGGKVKQAVLNLDPTGFARPATAAIWRAPWDAARVVSRTAATSVTNMLDATWRLPQPIAQTQLPTPDDPDPTSTTEPINVRNMHYMCMLSKAAYEDAASFAEHAQAHWGLTMFGHWVCDTTRGAVRPPLPGMPVVETLAYVARNDTAVVVAFRGTEPESLFDIDSDLAFDQINTGTLNLGYVHAGFFAGAGLVPPANVQNFHTMPHACQRYVHVPEHGAVIDELSDVHYQDHTVQQYLHPLPVEAYAASRDFLRLLKLVREAANEGSDTPRRIYLTGHSLGGALAALVAAAMARLGTHAHAVYTFGQPRTGDAVFAQSVETLLPGRVFRVVHGVDLVAMMPPKQHDGAGYTHHMPWIRLSSRVRRPLKVETDARTDAPTMGIGESMLGWVPRLWDGFADDASWSRLGVRAGMSFLGPLGPLASDHFMCDYEHKLSLLT